MKCSPQLLSLLAIFSLSVVGAVVTGFGMEATIRLSLVCTAAAVSGVFLLAPLRNVSRDAIPELIAKGIGVGIPVAALSHQLFLHSTLRPIAWIFPTLIALPRMVSHLKHIRSYSTPEPPSQLIEMLAAFTFALVAMMMTGWWFLIPPCLVLIGILCMKPVSFFRLRPAIASDNHQSKYIFFGIVFISSIVLARYLAGLNFLYFFHSFDQLFRSAIATSITEWGANENIGAVGTPLRYHWLAEASVGLIAKLSGVPTLQVVLRFAPFLFACAASVALWSLARRFQFSPFGMALAFGSIFWLSGIFRTLLLDTVRNPLAFALFFLFLNSLSDYQSSSRRLRFIFQIAFFVPLILLTDSQIGVIVCVTTVLISLFNGVFGRMIKRDVALLFAVGPLSLLFVKISILRTNSDYVYNPIFGLNNFLQFGRTTYDLYFDQNWWYTAIASLTILSVWSFRWIGIYGSQNLNRLLHAPHIACLTPALAGLLLANAFSMGASQGLSQQGFFLIGLVALPLISTDAISRDFGYERHQFRFWMPAVLLGVCIGSLLHYAFQLETGKTRSLALISIMTTPIIVLFLVRGVEWFSKQSDKQVRNRSKVARQALQVAIIVSLFASSSFDIFAGARNLTKSIRDEHGYLGSPAQLECLTWIRENTPKQSIVASNLWRVPLPTINAKYFLVSNQSERRVLVDGPNYIDLRMNQWIMDRQDWGDKFIDTPSVSSFEYLKSMNVSVVLVDFQYSKNRNLEPFATIVFMNDGCLVAILN